MTAATRRMKICAPPERRARRSARIAFGLPLLVICGMFCCSSPCTAQTPATQQTGKKPKKAPKPDALDQYLQTVRFSAHSEAPTTGSLWRPNGLMSDMASDDKARYVGDEVTIQLAESTVSAQQGSVQTARTMAASSGIAAFFGRTNSTMSNLFSPSSSQTLNGKGQTALATSFATTLGANIVEVLPDGLFVIEARRQVRVTDQTETIVLRGIVRRSDLSPTNVVLSSSISQLEVKMEGKGVITEGTHPTNAVVRILLRVLGF
ncbi:MAG: flagellar basal body L-ring protein FlgH [Candidatus Acidiferrales bacterium]